MNKKGWVKIVEAFLSVIIIAGVLLLFASTKTDIESEDLSSNIYDLENAILREIQLNKTIRSSIINLNYDNLPINSEEEGFPEDLKNKISKRKPNSLICESKICPLDEDCSFWKTEDIDSEIYAQETIISSTSETFSPRELKLFCWI